jgi:3-mercaptopyruvate sulfurtransferase SseA
MKVVRILHGGLKGWYAAGKPLDGFRGFLGQFEES